MSIRGYLGGLDYSQLLNARKISDEYITKFENEKKVALWVVSDYDLNYAAFTEDNYMLAVEKMAEESKKFASEYPGQNVRYEVIKRYFNESEVDAMLSL